MVKDRLYKYRRPMKQFPMYTRMKNMRQSSSRFMAKIKMIRE